MEASSEEVVKSPDEIEDGIISTQTVNWDPFTVFPKEIYVKIFDKLEDPVDKMNFMNAHVKWYELFKDKRTLFLFENVFKEVCRIDRDLGGYKRDWYDLRLVCHDWDEAVKTSLQLSARNFRLTYVGHRIRTERVFGLYNPSFYMFNAEKLENDLKEFSVTHPSSKNPFFSRKLYLSPAHWDEGEIGRYLVAIDAILTKYGHHIWYFNISMNLNPQICRQIARWLCLMPELKTLELENLKRLNQAELEEIREMELQQPDMKKLVVLKSERLPSVVFNKLFGNVREVERIQIWLPTRNKSCLRDYVVHINRESLKEAGFKSKNLVDLFEYLNRGESFPNLKALAINDEIKLDDETEWLEWKTAFKILEEKFPALEEFMLDLPEAVLDVDKEVAKNQSLECQLDLPKLKKLWISLPNLASIDFLSPCKALEELSVDWRREHLMNEDRKDVGQKEKIRFNVDLSTLWESNIWDEFPKLRELEVIDFGNRGSYHSYRYWKAGEERKYSARIDSEDESSDEFDYDSNSSDEY